MPMDNVLRELAQALGADFYGVADLSPARETIRAQGGPGVADYLRSVSIGVALMNAVVDPIVNQDDRPAIQNYRHHGYDVVNLRLDQIVSRLSSSLQREGHRALPIPASGMVNSELLQGAFSHKLGAHLAGLGWIGKSCLLITPEAGPRVRWATILTDAPLPPTGEPLEQRCGDCRQCVEICPVQAFTGRPFREEEPRSARYDAHRCQSYLNERQKGTGFAVCGLCLYICPHGRKDEAVG
ncbi:MAG: epoxyqueuosine reductase [Chloroflexi bacterium]|nr:epoxyqueuosine reductase [Chloroflexota bacterium]